MNGHQKDVKCAACDVTSTTSSVRFTPIELAELVLMITGLICVAIYAGALLEGYFTSRAAIKQFENNMQDVNRTRATRMQMNADPTETAAEPDFSGWSEGRVRAYTGTVQQGQGIAQALLEIPRIQLKAPVFDGTDELTLNHGVGLIAGTAWPGEPGNVGIAGHRDGFFRKLKDINLGDEIELATRSGVDVFVADEIQVVTPQTMSVLASDSEPSLTLVTCYPFYSIGAAPKRFVVKAHFKHHNPAESRLNPQPLNPSLEEQ